MTNPFELRLAALARLSEAQEKQAAASAAKAAAGGPTCVSLALDRSALDDMTDADMLITMANLAE